MIDNKKYYDSFSRTYDKTRDRGYHDLIDTIETHAVRDHYTGGSILEAGCGSGLVLQKIRSFADGSFGIDLSNGMLKHAKNRKCSVAQADILTLPFQDNAFDMVVSFKVLPHILSIGEAIMELCRITKPGGILILEFYNTRSLRGMIKRLKLPTKTSKKYSDMDVYTRYDSRAAILQLMPDDMDCIEFRGARIITPFAAVHRIPVLQTFFKRMELSLSTTSAAAAAGFIIYIGKKRTTCV
ncbi:class I SAM-dependent methyltransferase [bacterium]|nr:class I SAM-dependent methyltransferase [candidate division CSSED10-310 bacterium]